MINRNWLDLCDEDTFVETISSEMAEKLNDKFDIDLEADYDMVNGYDQSMTFLYEGGYMPDTYDHFCVNGPERALNSLKVSVKLKAFGETEEREEGEGFEEVKNKEWMMGMDLEFNIERIGKMELKGGEYIPVLEHSDQHQIVRRFLGNFGLD